MDLVDLPEKVGVHPGYCPGQDTLCERIDIYEGRIALKVRFPATVKDCSVDDQHWCWLNLPRGMVSISPTRQPNNHSHIVQPALALNGAWQYMRPAIFYKASLDRIGASIERLLTDKELSDKSFLTTRHGCVATVLNPVIVAYPLAWAINTHDVDYAVPAHA